MVPAQVLFYAQSDPWETWHGFTPDYDSTSLVVEVQVESWTGLQPAGDPHVTARVPYQLIPNNVKNMNRGNVKDNFYHHQRRKSKTPRWEHIFQRKPSWYFPNSEFKTSFIRHQ